MMQLFIGGIADGRWFDVPERHTKWVVEVNKPYHPGAVRQGSQMFLDVKRMHYRQERLVDLDAQGQRITSFVFVPEDGNISIIQQLIAGYNPIPQGH